MSKGKLIWELEGYPIVRDNCPVCGRFMKLIQKYLDVFQDEDDEFYWSHWLEFKCTSCRDSYSTVEVQNWEYITNQGEDEE